MPFSILGSVKSLIEKISARLHVQIKDVGQVLNNNTFHIHIGGTHNHSQNVISLPLERLSKDEKDELLQMLPQALGDMEVPILSDDHAKLLLEFNSKRDDGKDIVEALRGCIGHADITALRAALYIRAMHRAHKDISNLKESVVISYGERGRKICNLCSAGYFETMIVPLLREMRVSPEFQVSEFKRRYDLIVEEEAFSLFVHGGMSAASLGRDIVAKLERNKSYGKHYVNIHAIGSTNIDTVKSAAREVLNGHPDIEKVEDARSGNSLFVKLAKTLPS
ncbi:MAG: hypothetical protein PHF00_09675 [Elusimicrobia bacterium]|nr:hypothetical protein [Elusimicrobiota bacterium]